MSSLPSAAANAPRPGAGGGDLGPGASDPAVLEAHLKCSRRIAHDLNNTIGTVLGYAHLLLEDASKADAGYAFLEQVIAAGEEAKRLVVELLANANPGGRDKASPPPAA